MCGGAPSSRISPDFADQPPGASDEKHRDEDRQQRIGRQPAGHQDDQRRRDRRYRTQQIAEHVQDRAAQIERLSVAAVQDEEARQR